jgi:hypothetical protein
MIITLYNVYGIFIMIGLMIGGWFNLYTQVCNKTHYLDEAFILFHVKIDFQLNTNTHVL